MDAGTIILIIFAVITIILIIVAIIEYRQNVEIINNGSQLPQIRGWGSATPGADSKRNTCQIYTFPSINGQPGQPTLRNSVLNSLTPTSTSTAVCFDTDQIVAQQLTHTCQTVAGSSDTQQPLSVCYTTEGQLLQPGQSEVFYSADNCGSTLSCPGDVALLALNWNSPTGTMGAVCINTVAINGQNGNLDLETCNISNLTQLYRVTRMNPGATPPQPGQPYPNMGLLAQFLERKSGLCIIPQATNPISGGQVVLGSCSNNNGFVWALIPSLIIDGKTTPPQIAYIGNIQNIPSFNTPDDIKKFITSNNVLVMAANDKQIILAPYSFDASTPQGQLASSQYLDYSIYNLILQENPSF